MLLDRSLGLESGNGLRFGLVGAAGVVDTFEVAGLREDAAPPFEPPKPLGAVELVRSPKLVCPLNRRVDG